MKRWFLCMGVAMAGVCGAAGAGEKDLPAAAREAMAKAAAYFQSISVHGGWAGIYSLDLKQRYGESLGEKAKPTEIWVQPPGTPTVGEAMLRAYRATGQDRYLAAARAAARALAWGQRAEGGWDHRADVAHLTPDADRPARKTGRGTFDDRITQGALTFLMDIDQALEEPWLTEAVQLGWKFMLASQFPNGAWPQWYPLRGGYQDCYTFNDGAINDCIAVMVQAHRLYGRAELLDCAKRGGDFIILSQLPAPQTGWAQQYSHDLKPASARAFEPAGVCSAVAARNIRTLVELYLYTGDGKYLAPIPKAIDWLERSKLSDGVWSRLYEVSTNKPIYGDRDGKVHYNLDEVSEERRTGYSWQSDYGIGAAVKLYQAVQQQGREAYLAKAARQPSAESKRSRARSMEPAVRKVIAALDDQGRWITKDMIYCKDFVKNFNTLCQYVESMGK